MSEGIAERKTRLEQLGPYLGTSPAAPTEPREVRGRTLTYVQNNQERMHYADYRQQGRPVTSSAVASLNKEFN